jgi:hypothetical protein
MARAADPHKSREIEKALIKAGGKPDKKSTLGGVGAGGARGKEITASLDAAAAGAAAEMGGTILSLLARSVNQSLRRKRPESKGMTLSDSSELQGESEVDDIELPEGMRAAADDTAKEWEFERSRLKLSTMLGEGQFGQVW